MAFVLEILWVLRRKGDTQDKLAQQAPERRAKSGRGFFRARLGRAELEGKANGVCD